MELKSIFFVNVQICGQARNKPEYVSITAHHLRDFHFYIYLRVIRYTGELTGSRKF